MTAHTPTLSHRAGCPAARTEATERVRESDQAPVITHQCLDCGANAVVDVGTGAVLPKPNVTGGLVGYRRGEETASMEKADLYGGTNYPQYPSHV